MHEHRRPPMRHRRPSKLSMRIMFSLSVCLIFLITAGIVGIISFLVIETGIISAFGSMVPIVMILNILLSSVIVGTAVSTLVARLPLKPIHLIISKMRELSSGNFDVRLDIDRPPEFSELANSFNSMAQELGSIETLRKDFVNNFSHEFKTPIVSIKGFAELMKYGDLSPEEQGEYLDIIISESKRLADLSTNILYLSKVDNQGILQDKAKLALGEQIRHSILLLQSKWEEKQITMHIDLEDIAILGNEEMLGQVWLNLIDNAIKFTPEGGTINIKLVQREMAAEFVIADSGSGVDPASATRIFDQFYQGDASHATAGNGLGLTLVKKIVDLHKGTILCESNGQQGTTFTVTLPLA